MNLVLFCHPTFLSSRSMPRFAATLKSGYQARGHHVEVWSPEARVYRWLSGSPFAKWGGYIDQYLLFPAWVRHRLKSVSLDTLFVFCDQALGPWIPLVKGRPHVVHVHDLLALRSALGDIKENPTSLTGRIYQRLIRRGFRQSRHFISVSKKTRDDLHRFGQVSAETSEYVYNGLNFPYSRLPEEEAQLILSRAQLPVSAEGMVLHVGGAQWYKNLPGVIAIYAKYAAQDDNPLPLWCISPDTRNAAVRAALATVPQKGRVFFFSNLESTTLQAAYSHARVMLLPSLAEGFGWPIIEALACGCPVVTSDEPPMNEYAGEGIRYVPRMQFGAEIGAWAGEGASILHDVIARTVDPQARAECAKAWAKRFDADKSLDAYLSIYEDVVRKSKVAGPKDV